MNSKVYRYSMFVLLGAGLMALMPVIRCTMVELRRQEANHTHIIKAAAACSVASPHISSHKVLGKMIAL